MRWVVIAIAVFIVGYTYTRLHYAKKGRPFEPYYDMGQMVTVDRLLKLGFQEIPVTLQRPPAARPADRFGPAPAIRNEAGGLPPELARNLVFKPTLPERVESVEAPAIASGATYRIQFVCVEPDLTRQIHRAFLYLRGRQLFLLPGVAKIPLDLRAASPRTTVVASFPLYRLAPGGYAITLSSRAGSKHWNFTVPNPH